MDMITNRHITVTSWSFALSGARAASGRAGSRGLTPSRFGLPTEEGEGLGALPLHGEDALGCDIFLWFDDRVSFNLALSLPSVKRIVLVWKFGVAFTSFFVMLLTKYELLGVDGTAAVERGGGVGASDKSISFLVKIIG